MSASNSETSKRCPLESASSKGMSVNAMEIPNLKGELLTAERGKCPRTIMVTSSVPKEGKSTAAVAMALSLVQASYDRVLLIDASDDDIEAFGGWYKLDNKSSGLLDLLAGTTPLDSLVHKTDHDQLDILAYGGRTDVSTKTFDSGRFGQVLEDLKNNYDFIIVDGPSFLASSMAALITSSFDGLVVVVRCKSTRKQIVQQVMNKIELLDGNVIGTVMNYRTYYLPQWLYRWL